MATKNTALNDLHSLPLISVIVPIFNCDKYLDQCLDSLIRQTVGSRIEIILINDGSTDSSDDICKKFASSDTRIVYVVQKNSGVGPTRNKGISIAKSSWVSFVDSDDWIEPDAYEIMTKIAAGFDCDVLYGSEIKNACKKSHLQASLYDGRTFLRDKTLKNTFKGHVWRGIYRRKFLVDNKLTFSSESMCEDSLFTFSLLLKKEVSVVETNFQFYHYRPTPNSASRSTSPRKVADQLAIVQKMINAFNESNCHESTPLVTIARHLHSALIQLYDLEKNDRLTITSNRANDYSGFLDNQGLEFFKIRLLLACPFLYSKARKTIRMLYRSTKRLIMHADHQSLIILYALFLFTSHGLTRI